MWNRLDVWSALMASKLETRDVEPLTLRGAFQPSSIDDKARTVDVQWTTGQKVLRSGWDGSYYEELSLDPKEVRMDRLTSGRAPLLANHDSYSLDSVIGVVESATIGSARVRFAQGTPAADQAWSLVKQGILSNVSVGYRTFKVEKTKGSDGEPPTVRAVDWQPYEISLVPMGADSTAQVRSSTQDKNPCVLVTLAEENRTMDKTPEEKAQEVAAAAELDQKRTLEIKAEGAREARTRDAGIRHACRAVGYAADKIDQLVASDKTVDQVRELVLEELAKRSESTPIDGHSPVISVGEHETEKTQRGAFAALIQRAGLTKDFEALKERKVPGFKDFESAPGEFGGMRISRIAQEMLERRGVSTRGMNDDQIVGRALTFNTRTSGMTSTSDFAVLLENVMYKTLLGGYATAPDTWKRFCKTDTVQDFRNANRYRTGSFGVLDTVGEDSEFKNKSIPDGSKATINVVTKGNMIAVSRQALVNDDMGAIVDVTGKFGRAAGLSIETDVYALLTANSGLGANFTNSTGTQAFFDASNSNINGTGTALGVQGIDADRVVLAQQKDPSGNEFLDLRPQVLLVPIGLGAQARTINFAEYDVTQSNKFMVPNIVRGLFADVIDTPRLSGTRRYLFASPSDAAAIVVAFLNGQEAPFLEQRLGWRTDGSEWKLRIDYKAQFFDPKGAVTNAGV